MIAVVYRSDVEHLVRELAAQIARFSGKRVLIVDGPRAGECGLSATGSDEHGEFAHIGVLERLAERGVPVDVLAGTSAAAGIASLWALGQSPDRIAARFSELARHAVRPALPTRSLLSGRAVT